MDFFIIILDLFSCSFFIVFFSLFPHERQSHKRVGLKVMCDGKKKRRRGGGGDGVVKVHN